MSRPLKIVIGLATIWPALILVTYGIIYFAITYLATYLNTNYNFPITNIMEIIMLITLITKICIIGLLIFYFVHLLINNYVKWMAKILWIGSFIFTFPISMPIYWYLYIWREPQDLKSTEGGSG